jgi:hypothetical protein
MQCKKYLGTLAAAVIILTAILTCAGVAAANSYEILRV